MLYRYVFEIVKLIYNIWHRKQIEGISQAVNIHVDILQGAQVLNLKTDFSAKILFKSKEPQSFIFSWVLVTHFYRTKQYLEHFSSGIQV